jgi:hypothetical protein
MNSNKLILMKSSRAISRRYNPTIRRLSKVIPAMMMEPDTVFETLDNNVILAWLIAREDFIAFCRRESFKSYKFVLLLRLNCTQLCHTLYCQVMQCFLWTEMIRSFSGSRQQVHRYPSRTRVFLSRGCSVGIVNRLQAVQLGFDSQQGQRYFSSTPGPDRLWGRPTLLSSGY